MFIKRTKRTLRGKTHTNYLLVESVATERGPRHHVICSLGSLAPAPKAQWLKLAHHLLKEDLTKLNEDRLYRNMDRLYGKRGPIEAALCAKEKSLFWLKETVLLCDLTSTYFEGLRLSNAKAKRGYSKRTSSANKEPNPSTVVTCYRGTRR